MFTRVYITVHMIRKVITTRKYSESLPSLRGNPAKLISSIVLEAVRDAPSSADIPNVIVDPKSGLRYTIVATGAVLFVSMSPGSELISHTLVITVLNAIIHVMNCIFHKPMTPSMIEDNFPRFYSILDEVIFAGFPFILESNTIASTVPEIPKEDDGIIKKIASVVIGQNDSQNIPMLDNAITGISPEIWWRRGGVSHNCNEFYVDVIDTVNCIVTSEGKLVSGNIIGSLVAKCKLSDNPELVLAFKDPNLVKSMISFHPCVRIPRWKRDSKLSFVPPDGPFTLAEYSVMDRSKIQLPFNIQAQVDEGGKISVAVRPRIPPNTSHQLLSVENFIVTIKVSPNVSNATLFTQQGSVQFDSAKCLITWSIQSMRMSDTQGFKLDGLLRHSGGPIACIAGASFRVPGWSMSGVRIDSINITGVNYTPYKGVRYATVGGRIDVRI